MHIVDADSVLILIRSDAWNYHAGHWTLDTWTLDSTLCNYTFTLHLIILLSVSTKCNLQRVGAILHFIDFTYKSRVKLKFPLLPFSHTVIPFSFSLFFRYPFSFP